MKKSEAFVVIFKRTLLAVPVLVGVSFVAFATVGLNPDRVIVARLGVSPSQDAIDALYATLDLDQPLHLRYLDWLTSVLQGDLGNSYIYGGTPVADMIMRTFAISAQIAFFGFLWMVIISFVLGVISAYYRNQWPDQLVRVYAVLGISVPHFVVGIVSIIVFSLWLRWLPAGGWSPLSDGVVSYLKHLIMPSYAAGFLFIGIVTRMFRADILEVMNQEHVNAARALGLSRRQILFQDIIKPAIIPTFTTVGMALASLLAGIVLIEVVFAIPGFGQLLVRSVFNADLPILQGALLIVACIFIFLNLAVDITYFYLDPRIRSLERHE